MRRFKLKKGSTGYDFIDKEVPFLQNEKPGGAAITVVEMATMYPEDWEEVYEENENDIQSAINLLKKHGYMISKQF